MTLTDLLAALQSKGITLVCEGDSLRARPKEAITDELRTEIISHKAELVVYLTECQIKDIERLEREGKAPGACLCGRRGWYGVKVNGAVQYLCEPCFDVWLGVESGAKSNSREG